MKFMVSVLRVNLLAYICTKIELQCNIKIEL